MARVLYKTMKHKHTREKVKRIIQRNWRYADYEAQQSQLEDTKKRLKAMANAYEFCYKLLDATE